MPTILRKSSPSMPAIRREILHAVSWQVRARGWSPPTDLYETEFSFNVRVEIAGMRDQDFEISMENNILFITGSRPDQSERRAYHQMEIRFGKFDIAIGIPSEVNVEEATAEYKNGFLSVVLPKARSDRSGGA